MNPPAELRESQHNMSSYYSSLKLYSLPTSIPYPLPPQLKRPFSLFYLLNMNILIIISSRNGRYLNRCGHQPSSILYSCSDALYLSLRAQATNEPTHRGQTPSCRPALRPCFLADVGGAARHHQAGARWSTATASAAVAAGWW